MDRENQIEMIKKYGNKNSCYIPFEGGVLLSPTYGRLRKSRFSEDSTYVVIERL